jgi:hypothetical protein
MKSDKNLYFLGNEHRLRKTLSYGYDQLMNFVLPFAKAKDMNVDPSVIDEAERFQF